MSGRAKAFVDTNIVLYAFGADEKRDRALAVLALGCAIGVQVLNEFANVARRKLGMAWEEIEAALAAVRELCEPAVPLDLDIREAGLGIARRYGLSLYDALVVAAALRAGCAILWSEDMQDGLVIEGRLRVVNPFAIADPASI